MDYINILQCGNRAALDGIILCALSMKERCPEPIHLYLGTMDLSELDSDYLPITEEDAELLDAILREGCPESRVSLVDMTDGYISELLGGRNEDTRYTPYAMLRLLADLYPLPDRIIYLDSDVMMSGDIGELWREELFGASVGGVLDRYGRWLIRPGYMNSGVMLWDLSALRGGELAMCRKICRERRLLLCDQSAINMAVKKKRPLPRRFNEQGSGRADTVIRHFSMRIRPFPRLHTESIKPWQPELLHSRLGEYGFDSYIERWQRIKAAGYKYDRSAVC